jgi:hypothetical protein
MATLQHKQVAAASGPPREREWQVDSAAAAQVMAWAKRTPALLAQELAEMAEHFPHWLLALADADSPRACARCGELVIFAEGAARCVACDAPATYNRKARLAWLGHLPTLLRASAALERRLPALAAAGAPTVEAGGARYLLVPMHAIYPAEWPNVEPAVFYGPGILAALGLANGVSASHHLYSGGQACLYASGQWRGASVRVVLQQRVVNHLASLVKIASGVPPDQAFIGRIH